MKWDHDNAAEHERNGHVEHFSFFLNHRDLKTYQALPQVKKHNFKVTFWILSPITIWHNMVCFQFFSLNITPP